MKTGSRQVIATPRREFTRRGDFVRVLDPAYWGHMEHLSPVSLKPDDHTDVGLYEHGPDEDATNLWDQQTESLAVQVEDPPSRARAIGAQQVKRKEKRTLVERQMAFLAAVSKTKAA